MIGFSVLLAALVAVPAGEVESDRSTEPGPVAARVATGVPRLDGRTDDPIWVGVEPIIAFRQSLPTEDADPAMRTEARVSYDARNLYVLVRAFDPAPDSIVGRLSRRDVETTSDQITLLIDSYHDRKSGFLFSVTPSGVQSDGTIINDLQQDMAWDGVWEVATRIDELGWVAEFRIPFGQLRYPAGSEQTFGFGIIRDVARTGEKVSWPLWRRSRPGLVSQLGELTGLRGLGGADRVALVPYTVARDTPRSVGPAGGRDRGLAGGLDATIGFGGGLTLDATINPDFGQVEADPSVLNLSAFETIQEERRPFFLQNAGLFRYDITCGGPACNGLFYSRRIGRAPQLAAQAGDGDMPDAVPILGALKLTGRSSRGLSLGVLGALTGRAAGDSGRTAEPRTGYGVLRLQQDWRGGRSNAGLMVTGMHRELDGWSDDFLRRSAVVVGADTRHRLFGNNVMLRGYAAVSHVEGSPEAIARTQSSAVHYLQSPANRAAYDPTRTSLNGVVAAASIGKQGGGIVRYSTAFRYTSAGFEPNDAGFLQRADYQVWQNTAGLAFNRPTRLFRQAGVSGLLYGQWNSSGVPLGMLAAVQGHMEFRNLWLVRAGIQADGLGRAFDDRATRGGPAVRRNARSQLFLVVQGDARRSVVPVLRAQVMPRATDGAWYWGIDPELSARAGDRVRAGVGLSYLRLHEPQQWAGNIPAADGSVVHTFARVDQHIASLTTRIDVTATPTLSLQVYASPFVASGRYFDWRDLVDPRGATPDRRFRPRAGGDVSGRDFNLKEFRANAVLRWEYRPGSVLFVVWSQGRRESVQDRGTFSAGRDLGTLFGVRPQNTLAVKASYLLTL